MNENYINLGSLCEGARYSENLEVVINGLNPLCVLNLNYCSDYQGDVNIDVLLANGSVFIYDYSYGSCSGCDDWESRSLADDEIEEEMLNSAVIYSINDYMEFMKKRQMNAKLKEDIFKIILTHFPKDFPPKIEDILVI
jgi:hypothetical protein